MVEALVGVALIDAEAGGTATLGVTGVYSLPADTAEIKAGTKVYWAATGNPVGGPAGTGAATATEGSNAYAGIAWATKPAGQGQVLVKLGSGLIN